MAEAARLILDLLTRLGGGRLDVIQTVDALRDCVCPDWADEVSVWVPALAIGRLAPVASYRQSGAAVPEEVHLAVLDLLQAGTEGRLDPDALRTLTGGGWQQPPGAGRHWGGAVFAPLIMPGQAPGACIYFRDARRPGFTGDASEVLRTLTARITPLILAAALSDHRVFDRELTGALSEAVIAVDAEFRVTRWNPAAERLYGIPAEEAIGNPLATMYFTHYDDPDMDTDRAWEQLVRTDRWEGFVTQQSKAGNTVSVFASVNAIRDDLGHVVGAVAVNRDNSEIEAARSRVDLAETMLADVLDATGLMTVILDQQGTIIAANREWLDVALATDAPMGQVSVGADYLQPVRRSVAAGDAGAEGALEAIESVLHGSAATRSVDYRCDRPDGPHWYQMDVRRLGDSRTAVVAHREITQRHLLQVELAHSRTHDALTDLGNRAWLEQHVASSMRTRQPPHTEIGLIVCDVDGFAAVNEALGYVQGDEVLRVVAGRLRDHCPPGLVVVRLGGDQFAVLAESMWGAVALLDVAERLRAAVAAPIDVEGRRLILSLSVGVAAVLPSGTETAAQLTSELIARADAARLDSQSHGRNRVRHYRPDLRDRAASLLLMRHDFAAALRAGTLELHYQQIRRLADDAVVGLESLIRWPRPGSPMLTPATFAPMLDEPTIAGPLAAWTLQTAAEAAGEVSRRNAGGRPWVALNISAQQFLDLDVADHLARATAAAGLDPSAPVVEVTETATFTDDSRVVSQLAHVHDLGARVALDDFGTGFSSLAHLRSLPVDTVKIDKTFTAGVGSDATSDALARALIALAHDLGLDVVAEGVETAEQRDWLIDAGCDSYQGFLSHRPARLAEVLASLGD